MQYVLKGGGCLRAQVYSMLAQHNNIVVHNRHIANINRVHISIAIGLNIRVLYFDCNCLPILSEGAFMTLG